MNKLILPIAFFAMSLGIFCQSMKEIGFIEIVPAEILSKHKTETVEFLTAGKQSIGKYLSIKMTDIIEPIISKIPYEKRKMLLIIGLDSLNNKILTTYYDYDSLTTKIPPFYIHRRVMGNVGDTVVSWQLKGKKMMDLKPVQAELDKMVTYRIYLQIKKFRKEETDRIFKAGTVVYPQDQKQIRWLNGIKYLKIYLID